MTPDAMIDVVLGLDPLGDLPRTGWVLRGVRGDCESIAAHTVGVTIVAMMFVDAVRARGEEVDGERVLRMAVLHDAAEASMGDVPMPSKTPEVRAALAGLERTIVESLLPGPWVNTWEEAEARLTLEARIVKAADKVQMMVKALRYDGQGRGGLEDFWNNPGNFADQGLPEARAMFEAIVARAGRELPPAKT